MILFNQIVQVFALPEFTRFWKKSFRFQFVEGFRIRGVLVDRNHAGSHGVAGIERFREELFGRLCISFGAQKKLQGVPLRIHRPIQILPNFLHLSIGLINAPGIVGSFEMGATLFLQFGGVVLDEST